MVGNKIALKGNIIDVNEGRIIKNGVVIIKNNTISAIGKLDEIDFEKDCLVLEGNTIMPGLIDCHEHLFASGAPDLDLQSDYIYNSIESFTIRSAVFAEETLKSGITSVRDMGSPGNIGVAIRDAINKKLIKGPSVYTCVNALSITGGHGTTYPSWIHSDNSLHVFADGVEEVRKTVRRLISNGADLIKLLVTGGVFDITSSPGALNYNLEEILVAKEEAHKLGCKIATHCQGLIGSKVAAEAGVDTIEHGHVLDDEVIQEIKKKEIYLVPTVYCERAIADYGRGNISSKYMEKFEKNYNKHAESFLKAYKAGVKIAMGSDVGVPHFPHGESTKEIIEMVNLGMTPLDALIASTKNASEAIGIDKYVGTLEKGKVADILVLDKNPLEDIKVLENKKLIKYVIKNGEIIIDNS